MISISIDVTLLDKTKFKSVTRRDGKNAVFCEIILIETPDGQYGDYMVKQGISKEDRAAGVNMPILGNGKILSRGAPRTPAAQQQPPSDDTPVPF